MALDPEVESALRHYQERERAKEQEHQAALLDLRYLVGTTYERLREDGVPSKEANALLCAVLDCSERSIRYHVAAYRHWIRKLTGATSAASDGSADADDESEDK